MNFIKSLFSKLLVLVFLGLVGFAVVRFYPWIFAKTVKGKILDVQRVTNPSAIINSNVSDAQIHSYSVLIQGDDNKLYSASSEDRQWQVATKGYCVIAKFYRYPPWNLEKANTYFNARIEELSLCGPVEPASATMTPNQNLPVATPTAPAPQPAVTAPTSVNAAPTQPAPSGSTTGQ